MFALILRWILTALTLMALPSLISGIEVRDFSSALAATAVLAVLNVLVKPLLVLFTLPLTFLTLGLFILVINAIVFQFAGALVSGVYIAGFWPALGASLIVSLVSWVASSVADPRVHFRVVRKSAPPARRKVPGDTVDLRRTEDGRWE